MPYTKNDIETLYRYLTKPPYATHSDALRKTLDAMTKAAPAGPSSQAGLVAITKEANQKKASKKKKDKQNMVLLALEEEAIRHAIAQMALEASQALSPTPASKQEATPKKRPQLHAAPATKQEKATKKAMIEVGQPDADGKVAYFTIADGKTAESVQREVNHDLKPEEALNKQGYAVLLKKDARAISNDKTRRTNFVKAYRSRRPNLSMEAAQASIRELLRETMGSLAAGSLFYAPGFAGVALKAMKDAGCTYHGPRPRPEAREQQEGTPRLW